MRKFIIKFLYENLKKLYAELWSGKLNVLVAFRKSGWIEYISYIIKYEYNAIMDIINQCSIRAEGHCEVWKISHFPTFYTKQTGSASHLSSLYQVIFHLECIEDECGRGDKRGRRDNRDEGTF